MLTGLVDGAHSPFTDDFGDGYAAVDGLAEGGIADIDGDEGGTIGWAHGYVAIEPLLTFGTYPGHRRYSSEWVILCKAVDYGGDSRLVRL